MFMIDSEILELNKPVVSVCMVSYNHGKFIAQAIESVLMQKSNFKIELVIGEDCSTDNTRAIIEKYQIQYPDKIQLITSSHNVGMQPNFIRTYKACRGKYVAILEGDDYWIDETKIQRQVNLLETRPEVVMCFADAEEVTVSGQVLQAHFVPKQFQRDLNQDEILRNYCPPTLTVLFRNDVLDTLPDSFAVVENGDYFLFSMLTSHGIAAYLPGPAVADYRRHAGGVWSSLSQEKKYRANLNTKLAKLKYFGYGYYAAIMPAVNYCYVQLLTILWQKGKKNEFLRLYIRFLFLSIKTLNKEIILFTFQLFTGQLKPKDLL